MKKISVLAILMATMGANATTYNAEKFRNEILAGIDVVGANPHVEVIALENYNAKYDEYELYIPTSMYVRMGGGLNLGFATDKAQYNGEKYESNGSYTTQIGLGWNLLSFLRAEIDFQESTFKFSDLNSCRATYHTIGAMLYVDLIPRYTQNSNTAKRRIFVPFIGAGAGIGAYEFQGTDGAHGFVASAPRATLGFNIMITDLIGIDIAYQYQTMIGNGFGWGTHENSNNNISNIMASFRMNF